MKITKKHAAELAELLSDAGVDIYDMSELYCDHCGTEVMPNWNFCPDCGKNPEIEKYKKDCLYGTHIFLMDALQSIFEAEDE